MGVGGTIMLVIHVSVSVVLIIIVAVMQQKHEGISGIMGGGATSTRGIKGMDEGMRKFITYVGFGFFMSCIIFSLISS